MVASPPNELPRLRWPALLAAAALVCVGLYLDQSLTITPGFSDGLEVSAFYFAILGGPLIATLLLVSAGIARIANIRTGGRSGRWLIVPAALIATGFIADGFHQHRPATRFKKFVANPMPASVTDIRMAKADSFGDGNAWVFRFHIDPADFPSLQRSMNLTEISVDRAGHQKHIAVGLADLRSNSVQTPESIKDQAWPEDRLFRRDSHGLYTRPDDARFFYGPDRTLVISGETGSVVWVYRNLWANQ